jgi:hypothetical protein
MKKCGRSSSIAIGQSVDEEPELRPPRPHRSPWMRLRMALLLLAAAGVAFSPEAMAKNKKADPPKKAGHDKKGGGHERGKPSTGGVVRGDVQAWILANNPGLPANFLKTEPPDRTIKIPDGRTVPIFKLKQFLDVNFRLTFYARKNEKGSNIVPVMEERLRKLMARPEFRERVMTHRREYKIAGKGKVSSKEAYNHFRNIDRRLGVTASKKVKAPVGGGGGINAPSWAVWKQMNLFFHEACHCIGINHDSGGLSGPIAGTMRKWDRKKLWNYETIDLNALGV